MTVKEQIKVAVEDLPDDCTLEDVQYRLYVLQKIERSFAAADRGEYVTQDELRKRINEWRSK
jgi:predicted transcriptional regulator